MFRLSGNEWLMMMGGNVCALPATHQRCGASSSGVPRMHALSEVRSGAAPGVADSSGSVAGKWEQQCSSKIGWPAAGRGTA